MVGGASLLFWMASPRPERNRRGHIVGAEFHLHGIALSLVPPKRPLQGIGGGLLLRGISRFGLVWPADHSVWLCLPDRAAHRVAALPPERQPPGMDDSCSLLPVGEHARFLADRSDFVFDHHGGGVRAWKLGRRFSGAMDNFAAQEAVTGLGRECGCAVRESIRFTAGVLSLRPRVPTETQH